MKSRMYAARAAALALVAGVSAPALNAYAANDTTHDPVAQATAPTKGARPDQFFKISEDAYTAMRDVRAARLAIFNGNTRLAAQLVSQAKKKIGAADKEAVSLDNRSFTIAGIGERVYDEAGKMSGVPGPLSAGQGSMSDYDAATGKTPGAAAASDAGTANGASGSSTTAQNTRYIPIDAQLIVREGFVSSPGMAQKSAKTNQQQAGNTQAAGNGAEFADVDMVTAWALVPADATKQAVDRANDLIGQQKWHEANMALKQAEDGIVIGALDVEGLPADQVRNGGTSAAKGASGQQHANAGGTTSKQ